MTIKRGSTFCIGKARYGLLRNCTVGISRKLAKRWTNTLVATSGRTSWKSDFENDWSDGDFKISKLVMFVKFTFDNDNQDETMTTALTGNSETLTEVPKKNDLRGNFNPFISKACALPPEPWGRTSSYSDILPTGSCLLVKLSTNMT